MSKIYTGTWYGMSRTGKTKQEVAEQLGAEIPEIEFTEMDETAYILQDVPPEFRAGLSYMAYERGHYAGEAEVLLILRELISSLKPQIEAYRDRLAPYTTDVEDIYIVSQMRKGGKFNKWCKSQELWWYNESQARAWFDKTEDWFKASNAVFKVRITLSKIERCDP